MRRPGIVKRSGPYHVESYSQTGTGEVYMRVLPAYPQYAEDWPETRKKGEGGGPSIFMAMDLAEELEAFLNEPYTQEAVTRWKAKIAKCEGVK